MGSHSRKGLRHLQGRKDLLSPPLPAHDRHTIQQEGADDRGRDGGHRYWQGHSHPLHQVINSRANIIIVEEQSRKLNVGFRD